MSGLEALGLACNIFQVISFGHETIDLCKRVYKDGSPCAGMKENATFLGDVAGQIRGLHSPAKASKDEQRLFDVASKCQKVATDLQEEVNFIVGSAKKGNLAATLKVAAKTNWRRRRLDTLEKKLNDVQRVMETGLLARLCNKMHIFDIKLEDLSKDIRKDLYHFVDQYQKGHRSISGLVSKEALETRNHTTAEVQRAQISINERISAEARHSEAVIKNHVTNVAALSTEKVSNDIHEFKTENKKEGRHERLLNSLKFSGMNERRNQVSESHESTFKWAFEEEKERVPEEGERQEDSKDTPKPRWNSFASWLKSDERIYWICGKAGSGKTTLTNYLLSNPRTKELLEFWKPNCVLVSHFFWRPGSAMQRNLKGFLCAVLYQILKQNDDLVAYVSETYDDSATKDSDTDWSRAEIRKICLDVIKRCHRPICLFLDGIDEIDSQEGLTDLLKILEEYEQIPHMKMCVSSRLDQPIYDRLGNHAQLKIHDLTSDDLRQYALGTVHLSSSELADWAKLTIVSLLVQKADGVFLWLVLAINSVNRGISNGDELSLLLERINALPGDLIELYKDMWARMKDDKGIYRQKAALYFNLVIASREGNNYILGQSHAKSLMASNISIMEMKFASIPPKGDFFTVERFPSGETLLKQCQNTEKSIRICCAGLLEITETGSANSEINTLEFPVKEYNALRPYISGERSVRFIHRTAFDFMTDTVEGKEILDSDKTSMNMLRLRILRAALAVRGIYLFSGLWWIRPFNKTNPALEIGDQGTFCNSLELILDDISYLTDTIAEDPACVAEAQDIVRLTELVYNIARPMAEQWRRSTGEFLIRAAHFNLGEYVPKELNERPATKLLKDIVLMSACASQFFFRGEGIMTMIQKLLEQGCGCNTRNVSIHRFDAVCLQESSWTSFLRTTMNLFQRNFNWFLHHMEAMDRYIVGIPRTIDYFVAHGANLDEKMLLAFEIGESETVMPVYVPEVWTSRVGSDAVIVVTTASFVMKAVLAKLDYWRTHAGGLSTFENPAERMLKLSSDPGTSTALALFDFDCEDGQYREVSKEDADKLGFAMELWMLHGQQYGAMGELLPGMWKEAKERSTKREGIDKMLADLNFVTHDPSVLARLERESESDTKHEK